MRHRLRAGFIHLCLSATIAALVFLPIYFIWYPDVLYESAGGRELFLLIVAVDVTLGPLITTIVYVPGKWGLKFDLVVIGTLQLIALGYGVSVLFESRPVNIVFVKDRFELVRANEYPEGELEKLASGAHGSLTWTGPRIVGARLPTDFKEKTELLFSTIGGGPDVHLLPRYYVPYDEVRALAKEKGERVQKLRDRNPGPGNAAEIAKVVASTGRKEDELRFLPMRAGKFDLTVFIDAKTGAIVKISSIKPWGDI
jgi:hypothetical protein